MKIIQDTREQRGLFLSQTDKALSFEDFKKKFKNNDREAWINFLNNNIRYNNKIFGTIKTGDYSFVGDDGKDYREEFSIEYKSPSDIFGTLSQGHDRFNRELDRAKEFGYFAIVIGASYSDIKEKNFHGSYNIKRNSISLLKSLFTIHIKRNIPVFFTSGRIAARDIINNLAEAYYKNVKGLEKEKSKNI